MSDFKFYHGSAQNKISPGDFLIRRDETEKFLRVRKRGMPTNSGAFAVIAPISLDKIEACYFVWTPEQALEWAINLNKNQDPAVWEVEIDPHAWCEIHLNGYWTADGPGQDSKNWIACQGFQLPELLNQVEVKLGLYQEIRFFGQVRAIHQIL